MDTYITAATVKYLREKKGLTQAQLADTLGISSKTVSKWETAKGLPDITLIQPLATALGVSVVELMSGHTVTNRNLSSNLLRSSLYVCPLCGNILCATGNALISCCGITLPPLQAEDVDDQHRITLEPVEDEYFISVRHPMTKQHYLSFVAHVTADTFRLIKWYPEGNAETRMTLRGGGYLYLYCNKHGLMKQKVSPARPF